MTSSGTHHGFARACRRSHWLPTHPSSPRCGDGWWLRRQHQRGVVAIEFALLFMFGVLPLLLLTFTGIMLFAAKQSLELAAADGARAALQYPAPNKVAAQSIANQRMQWLQDPGVTIEGPRPCESDKGVSCITVTTTYNYENHPFLPGTEWMISGGELMAKATIQLPELPAGTP